MSVKLLTEHLLECLSLKGGCRGLSESTYVKMPHCWKSHALAHNLMFYVISEMFYVIKEMYYVISENVLRYLEMYYIISEMYYVISEMYYIISENVFRYFRKCITLFQKMYYIISEIF